MVLIQRPLVCHILDLVRRTVQSQSWSDGPSSSHTRYWHSSRYWIRARSFPLFVWSKENQEASCCRTKQVSSWASQTKCCWGWLCVWLELRNSRLVDRDTRDAIWDQEVQRRHHCYASVFMLDSKPSGPDSGITYLSEARWRQMDRFRARPERWTRASRHSKVSIIAELRLASILQWMQSNKKHERLDWSYWELEEKARLWRIEALSRRFTMDGYSHGIGRVDKCLKYHQCWTSKSALHWNLLWVTRNIMSVLVISSQLGRQFANQEGQKLATELFSLSLYRTHYIVSHLFR